MSGLPSSEGLSLLCGSSSPSVDRSSPSGRVFGELPSLGKGVGEFTCAEEVGYFPLPAWAVGFLLPFNDMVVLASLPIDLGWEFFLGKVVRGPSLFRPRVLF